MQGPAIAAPAVETSPTAEATSAEAAAAPAVAPTRAAREREVVIDDSWPGVQESLPQPVENREAPSLTQPMLPPDPIVPEKAPQLPDAPYPNPTMTPPEMTEPSNGGLDTPKI